VSDYSIIVAGSSAIILLALAMVINHSALGLRIRSAFDDPVAARLVGIRISAVHAASWTAGGALGGAAGAMLAPLLFLSPDRMLLVLLLAFSAAIVGGFTSLYGTVAGGLIIAFVQQAGATYISVNYSDIILYGFVAVFLMIRPYGLFGNAASEISHTQAEGTSWSPLATLAGKIRARVKLGASVPRVYLDTAKHAVTPILFLAVIPAVYGFGNLTAISLLITYIAILGIAIGISYAGQISMGQIAFMAIGLFTSARIVDGRPGLWWLAILASAGLSLAVAGVLAWPAGRLQGAYFAVLTLAIGLATSELIVKWTSVTGGGNGLTVDVPNFAPATWYFIVAGIATALYVVVIIARNSAFGRTIVAARDNPAGAAALGIRVNLMRSLIFVTTGTLGGIAGSLYAFNVGFASGDSFTLDTSILLFVAAAVAKSMLGSVWGAVLVTLVPIWLSGSSVSNAIYGLALLVVVFLLPGDFSSLDLLRIRGVRQSASFRRPAHRDLGMPEVVTTEEEKWSIKERSLRSARCVWLPRSRPPRAVAAAARVAAVRPGETIPG
jgi:branched-chain amino acid transport system permease protein